MKAKYLLLTLLCIDIAIVNCALQAPSRLLDKDFKITSTPTWQVNKEYNGFVTLNKYEGPGPRMVTHKPFKYGTFSVKLKLPSGFSAGIVTAFYFTSVTSKSSEWDIKTRDEIDFEFLGHTDPTKILIATNFYADGVGQSRYEEGFKLWFDPSAKFHTYTIRWTPTKIMWFVDAICIRVNNYQSGWGKFPSKPMQLAFSVWDASAWATEGGKIKANYAYAPFKVTIGSLNYQKACKYQYTQWPPSCSMSPRSKMFEYNLSKKQRVVSYLWRKKYAKWSYRIPGLKSK